MGGFRLDAGGCGTVAELLDDPLSGVSLSRRGGRPLDCSQLLDPAKSLFARVLDDNGNLPAGGLGDCCSHEALLVGVRLSELGRDMP
jgi:hypothetical protein